MHSFLDLRSTFVRLFRAGVGVVLVAIAAPAGAQTASELATTVDDGFTMAVVGDVIIAYSLEHMMTEPGFSEVVDILRSADVTTGNLEGHIIDARSLDTTSPGGFGGEPNVAAWLPEMGFDLMQRSNNHANDFGVEGLAETSVHLDRIGLQHAGYGDTYASARAARFFTSRRGRVGMVAAFATDGYGTNVAQPASGEWPGRGGISVLSVQRIFMIPEDQWDAVRRVRNAFPNGTGFYARGANSDTEIALLGETFRKAAAGTSEPYYAHEMNQRDLGDLIAAVREGKLRSDFMTFAIHSHHFRDAKGGYRGPGIPEAEHLDTNPSVPDFHQELAHAVIDAGADMYQGTGVHAIRGIEIYNGRPIFYGLGEFVRQMDVIGIAGRGGPTRSDCEGCPFPAKFESFIALNRYENGRVAEIRIHPVELGYDSDKLARRGIPRMAPPEVGRRILTRLQELSAPFGTRIDIEGNVGVIRP